MLGTTLLLLLYAGVCCGDRVIPTPGKSAGLREQRSVVVLFAVAVGSCWDGRGREVDVTAPFVLGVHLKHEGPIKAMHQFVLAPRRTFALTWGAISWTELSSPGFAMLVSMLVHHLHIFCIWRRCRFTLHMDVHINTKPESSSCTEMQWFGRSIFFWPENRGAWYCWTALQTSTGTVIHRCVPTHELPTHEDTRGSNLFWGRC